MKFREAEIHRKKYKNINTQYAITSKLDSATVELRLPYQHAEPDLTVFL